MSLVYLSGNELEPLVSECKQKLEKIGHSVIVVDKFDWNILCRCDCLVIMAGKYNVADNTDCQYAFDHFIPVYSHIGLPELEKHETDKPTLTKMTTEWSMKQYRDNILRMNSGEFVSDGVVLGYREEEIVA